MAMKNYELSYEEKDLIARLGPMFEERDRVLKGTYAIDERRIRDTLFQLGDMYMKRLPELLGYAMNNYPSVKQVACQRKCS